MIYAYGNASFLQVDVDLAVHLWLYNYVVC